MRLIYIRPSLIILAHTYQPLINYLAQVCVMYNVHKMSLTRTEWNEKNK